MALRQGLCCAQRDCGGRVPSEQEQVPRQRLHVLWSPCGPSSVPGHLFPDVIRVPALPSAGARGQAGGADLMTTCSWAWPS